MKKQRDLFLQIRSNKLVFRSLVSFFVFVQGNTFLSLSPSRLLVRTPHTSVYSRANSKKKEHQWSKFIHKWENKRAEDNDERSSTSLFLFSL